MPKKKEIWNQIKKNLESLLSKSEYQTWFSQTTLKKLESDLAILEVPNKFIGTWIQENYLDELRKLFETSLGVSPEIHFSSLRAGITSNDTEPQDLREPHSIRSFVHPFNPSLTFENFVIGKSNRFAYSSALDVARKPATHYNPLFIFSKLSAGKTHLLHAIGNHITNNNPRANVRFVSSDRFTSDLSYAIRNRRMAHFREIYRNLDVLIIDDIHFLAGRKRSQQEFTTLFNIFYETEKQIVISSKNTPTQIQDLTKELISRLEWGLLTEIQTPDQKTKIEIIKRRANKEYIEIPEDVSFFLANATNDIKALIDNLVRLETYTSLYQRTVDISTVKALLKSSQSVKIGPRDIQEVTAGYFDIPFTAVLSNEKKRKFSYPRQLAMYLCRKLTSLSYKEIGEAFGNKDHSTVIYAVKRIEKEKDKKRDISNDLNKLEKLLT